MRVERGGAEMAIGMKIRWIRELRENTAQMKRGQRAAYIAEYYWYHILLTFLAAAAVVLAIYNFTVGRQTVSFACAIINEQTDDERDSALCALLSDALNLQEKEITVDSNYKVSYGAAAQTDAFGSVDYTGYDKFFFGWSGGDLDVVVMPSSLLSYCLELGGEFRSFQSEEGVSIELKDTLLASFIQDNPEDPMVVVCPLNGKHEEAAEKFLQYINLSL